MLGAVAEDDLGALAHEREGERAGVGLPHDGVEPLDEVAEALLGGHARGLQALFLAQVLHDQEQAGGSSSAMRMAVMVIRTGRLSCRCRRRRSKRMSRWATPVASTSSGAGEQAVGAHDQVQLAAEDIGLVQVKRVEEGRIDGEHAQVGADEQEAGGHAGDDRLRVPPEVEDRALLLHPRAQERARAAAGARG